MRSLIIAPLFFALGSTGSAVTWSLDAIDDLLDVHGAAHTSSGVSAQSLTLGGDSLIELRDSSALGSVPFTVSLWFNPYVLDGGQQMLIGKNRYSLNERQWGLIIEPDGHLRAYVWQGKWATITCEHALAAGHWHQASLVVNTSSATLFLNGKAVGQATLSQAIKETPAPITLGGILDNGKPRQPFQGALDQVQLEPRALAAGEIAAAYHPVTKTHALPEAKTADFPLWDASQKLADARDLPVLEGAEFHVIK